MVHVDKMLRVVSDWRPLYEGERKKTIIQVQNTLKDLSYQTIELPTLYKKLLESPADYHTKKDALKMARILYNTLAVSDDEQAENEAYLKKVRKNRKPLSAVVKELK